MVSYNILNLYMGKSMQGPNKIFKIRVPVVKYSQLKLMNIQDNSEIFLDKFIIF